MVSTNETFIKVDDVMKILGVGKTKAYDFIKICNAELAGRGYFVMRGKCPRKYVEQKIYGYEDDYDPSEDLQRIPMVAEESEYLVNEKAPSE